MNVKIVLLTALVVAAAVFSGCLQEPASTPTPSPTVSPSPSPNTEMANPASVNCVNLGGRVDIRTDPTSGGQYGVCVFSNGTECEEWKLFRGEPCETTPTPSEGAVCPTLWQPVCGTNNQTYANACISRAAGAEIAKQGMCAQLCNDSDSRLKQDIEGIPKNCSTDADCQLEAYYNPSGGCVAFNKNATDEKALADDHYGQYMRECGSNETDTEQWADFCFGKTPACVNDACAAQSTPATNST